MEFHFFVSSFCRVVQVDKTKKRQNEEMEFHFFVCSFCRVVQVAKTKIWISFLRFFVLSRCTSRQNEETTKRRNGISFLRFVALYKSPKRRYGFHFFVLLRFVALAKARQNDKVTAKYQFDFSWLLVHFVVCSFCRLPQGANTTERQRDKMRFCGHFILPFVRFVALCKSPKRRNEISFWRFFVLLPSIRRQNEQTKWPYPASINNFRNRL